MEVSVEVMGWIMFILGLLMGIFPFIERLHQILYRNEVEAECISWGIRYEPDVETGKFKEYYSPEFVANINGNELVFKHLSWTTEKPKFEVSDKVVIKYPNGDIKINLWTKEQYATYMSIIDKTHTFLDKIDYHYDIQPEPYDGRPKCSKFCVKGSCRLQGWFWATLLLWVFSFYLIFIHK